MKPTIVGTALMLALSLAACSEDTPAVCDSLSNLKASVADVKAINLSSSDDLSALESGLKTIGSDLTKVKTDAESEFASQIETVETSYAALKTSVEAATTNPAAATLSAAGSALRAFGTDVQTLISDVQSTC
jgi:hypothetical protein